MFCKRLLSFFLPAAFLACAASIVLAQDSLIAEPTHYRLLFENEFVRVININFEPHAKTGWCTHRDGVIVAMTAGHMQFTDEHGKTKVNSYLPGDTRWVKAVRHMAENLDDKPYNAIFVEMKPDKGVSVNRPAQPCCRRETQALDTARALSLYGSLIPKPLKTP